MNNPRFCEYREIKAVFNKIATCGHEIRKGDYVGFAWKNDRAYTRCADCWYNWVSENAEADILERTYSY
jgi:hypothetical protein